MHLHLKFTGEFLSGIDLRLFTKEHALRTDADLATMIDTDRFVSLKQMHGNITAIVREASQRTIHADAAITDIPGLVLTVRAADCQQLVVVTQNGSVCGVAHAGWKGLKAGIIPSFFDALKHEWNIDPTETQVIIGPSLCLQCAEFSDPSVELEGLNARFFHGRNADLRGIADDQLISLGVPADHINRHSDCTKCMSDLYWSYRGGDREKVKEGWCNVMTVNV